MGLQSWMIKSWPIIDWFLPTPNGDWPCFLHMSTQVRQERRSVEPCVGSTVWVGAIAGAYAGLAWEWVEVRPGVLMLADPNSITTNLQMVDKSGRPQEELHALIMLNRVLHRLPWQEAVADVIAAGRLGGEQIAAPRLAGDAAPALAVRAA
jgi:hypothetical protein